MGHVNHGKTTLLDYIRKTNIAGREAGGITQSIGAYEIVHAPHESRIDADNQQISADMNQRKSAGDFATNRKITFIDTPGHEAFSKMRARGAKTADIAILVVAADDGVMPQTKESIEILKKSKTPFIVAVNKTDRPGADVDRIKQQLAEAGVFLEGYGGNISWQAISAKTGQSVNELLDLILLAAELEDLKYDPAGRTEGIILSAQIDPRRGNVVTAIVKNGKIKIGQAIATASALGKIKALENFLGEKAKELEPSAPAVIYGFEALPQVGEEFFAGKDKVILMAEEIYPVRSRPAEGSATDALGRPAFNGVKLILRAEEHGSLEALEGLIEKLGSILPLTVIDSEVGNIYENEVKLAAGAGALIIGFKTKIDRAAENLAKGQNVAIIVSDVIYDLEKLLRDYAEKSGAIIRGVVEILATFGEREGRLASKGKTQIVGGRITEGIVENKLSFEISRNEEKIGEGRVLNLQSQKRDIPRAETGQEVGLLVESETAIAVGDKITFR
jgi:translation initiation factor IF-2